uniref:Uncharacterized protein n=1 Tax=Triticum urartu TaxID=4572 RepID=A0A8R7UI37_TRIUA
MTPLSQLPLCFLLPTCPLYACIKLQTPHGILLLPTSPSILPSNRLLLG